MKHEISALLTRRIGETGLSPAAEVVTAVEVDLHETVESMTQRLLTTFHPYFGQDDGREYGRYNDTITIRVIDPQKASI